MTSYVIFKWVISCSVMFYLLAAPPFYIYSLFASPTFRSWNIIMIQNNPGEINGTPDKGDGKDFILLSFGYLSGIVSIAVMLGWWLSGENLWEISTASGVLSGGFFGISKIPNKKD